MVFVKVHIQMLKFYFFLISRWLRARKFVLEDTIKMVEEATECTSSARKHDFFPSPSLALGCDSTFYIQQYPQVYYGHAKNGCPVFYSKPAQIDMKAIECLTSLANIINFHWNAMMHDFVSKLKDQYVSSNGSFKRYACVCILDLKHLTAAQLSKRPLNLIKEQSAIDSLCFPETLSHMAIINAPGFFAFTWKIIKSWIDPRTASKVSVIGSNKDSLVKHLGNIISLDSLPKDYGGRGKSFDELLQENMIRQNCVEPTLCGDQGKVEKFELKVENKETFLIPIRGKSTQEIHVKKDSLVKLTVSTRSTDGGILLIRDESGSTISSFPKEGIHIKHLGCEDDENELPTKYDLDARYGIALDKQGKYQVELHSSGSKYKTVYILVAATEFSKHAPTQPMSQGKQDHSKPESSEPAVIESTTLLCSQSICTGTFQIGKPDSVVLSRPTPIIRKEKKFFPSTISGVHNKHSTPSPPRVKRTNKSGEMSDNGFDTNSRLSHITAGCGEFPPSLSKYLE